MKLEQRLRMRCDQKRVSDLGPFGEAPSFRLAEGHRLIFEREDGVENEVEFGHAEAEFKVSVDELPNLTLDQLVAKMDKAAAELARQQVERAVSVLNEAVETVGNTLHMRGEPFQEEHLFQALEKISIDFDESGQPYVPALLMGPDMADRATKVVGRITSEPDLRRRYDQIISRKREEWRARESRRKLVG
jgi:hypothetical protein